MPPFPTESPNTLLPLLQMWKISKRNSFTYSLGIILTAAFLLVPGASGSVCELFNRSTSVPYSPYGLLDVSPIGFPTQTFWGLISPLHVSRVGMAYLGQEPLTPQAEAPSL